MKQHRIQAAQAHTQAAHSIRALQSPGAAINAVINVAISTVIGVAVGTASLTIGALVACPHTAYAAAASSPSAPAAYRCQTAQHGTIYSQLPCADEAQHLHARDARTDEQQQQAKRTQEQAGKLASRMTRERQHEERIAAKETAIALTPPIVQKAKSVLDVPGDRKDTGSGTYKRRQHRHFKALVPKTPITPAVVQ